MYINNVSWIISINDVVFLENVRKNRMTLFFLVSRPIFIHVEIWLRISNVIFSREVLLCFVLHAMYAHWNSIRVAFFLKNFLFLSLHAAILDNKCQLNTVQYWIIHHTLLILEIISVEPASSSPKPDQPESPINRSGNYISIHHLHHYISWNTRSV